MYIDRILYPIRTLGPGNRIVLWTAGCSKSCPGCSNPELWGTEGIREVSVRDAAQIIRNICREHPVDGITFTGGDPLEQAEELMALLGAIKPVVRDILVYTGYTFSQLPGILGADFPARLKQLVTVLIDGPYVEALNDGASVLRGSVNQNIMIFDETAEPVYRHYLAQGRTIQNVMMGDTFIAVGIPKREKD